MSGRILRYTLHERLIHWVAGFAFVYLLVSGLAFYSPRLYWLVNPLGGGQTARAWHPWAGVLFTAVCVWMYRIWRGDMAISEQDRAWRKAIGRYVRNQDKDLPPAGRFNAGQKYFFWLMFWGGFLLLASGAVLWFPERIPWSLRSLRYAAVLIHVSAALATIGGFIIHVYMGTAVVRGGFTSIVRGEVTREWARAHHPLWLNEKE
ncbi:MAG: formate dehydrogenase subunit gamma [Acidobacteria bacterium]|nr:formate dehydrogenase subunit gamma [Acidobacteriota bacterium]